MATITRGENKAFTIYVKVFYFTKICCRSQNIFLSTERTERDWRMPWCLISYILIEYIISEINLKWIDFREFYFKYRITNSAE